MKSRGTRNGSSLKGDTKKKSKLKLDLNKQESSFVQSSRDDPNEIKLNSNYNEFVGSQVSFSPDRLKQSNLSEKYLKQQNSLPAHK